MRLLGRAILIPLALLFAVPAGAVALFIASVLDPVAGAFGADLAGAGFFALRDALIVAEDPETLTEPFQRIRNLVLTLLVAPPVFIALVGEVAGWRAFLWYAGATGALTALMPWLSRAAARAATLEELHVTGVLFVAGVIAGAIYWLIAGSSAGRREPALRQPGPAVIAKDALRSP